MDFPKIFKKKSKIDDLFENPEMFKMFEQVYVYVLVWFLIEQVRVIFENCALIVNKCMFSHVC